MHTPSTSGLDAYKKLSLVWYEFEEKLKTLEEMYIKTQCIYNLMSSPKVNDTIDEYAFKDFKQQYDQINEALQQVCLYSQPNVSNSF